MKRHARDQQLLRRQAVAAARRWAQIVRDELGLDRSSTASTWSDMEPCARSEAEAIAGACADHGLAVHSVFTGLRAYSASLMLAPARPGATGLRLLVRRDPLRGQARRGRRGGHVGSLSRRDADDPEHREALWSELQRDSPSWRACPDARFDALLVENMACAREPCTMAKIEVAAARRRPDTWRSRCASTSGISAYRAPGARTPIRTHGCDASGRARRSSTSSSPTPSRPPLAVHHARQPAGRIDPARVLDALGRRGAATSR